MDVRTKLHALCTSAQHQVSDAKLAVVPEPYVPFLPNDWNGILVLGEAQNLSKRTDYRGWLEGETPEGRIRRLGVHSPRLGVAPWDSGALRAAVRTVLGEDPALTAVSNAVPWTTPPKTHNLNPTHELRTRAVAFWKDMLPILRPRLVVTAGAVARDVMRLTTRNGDTDWELLAWPSASPRVIVPLIGFFDGNRASERHPGMKEALGELGKHSWIKADHAALYACLAMLCTKERRLANELLPAAQLTDAAPV